MKRLSDSFYNDSHISPSLNLRGALMEHPWLLIDMYSCGSKNVEHAVSMFEDFLARYIALTRVAEKKGLLEIVVEKGFDRMRSPDGLLGFDRLSEHLDLDDAGAFLLTVGLTGVDFHVRRYGDCLGIVCLDRFKKPHQQANEDLAKIADEYSYLVPFHHVLECNFGSPQKSLDLSIELSEMRNYVPTISWSDVSDANLAGSLMEEFLYKTITPTRVGEYCGLPVCCRLQISSPGLDPSNAIVRRGALSLNDEIFFEAIDDNNRIALVLCYYVRTVALQHSYRGCSVKNFSVEQYVMIDAMRVIHAGLYERAYQRMIEHNKHLIAMK